MSKNIDKDICIGTLQEQRIYLMWKDIKSICNKRIIKENKELKALLNEVKTLILINNNSEDWNVYDDLIKKIDEALGEIKRLKKNKLKND